MGLLYLYRLFIHVPWYCRGVVASLVFFDATATATHAELQNQGAPPAALAPLGALGLCLGWVAGEAGLIGPGPAVGGVSNWV